jgi:hypothetical protein
MDVADVAKRLHDKPAQEASTAFFAMQAAGKNPYLWYNFRSGEYRVSEDNTAPRTK